MAHYLIAGVFKLCTVAERCTHSGLCYPLVPVCNVQIPPRGSARGVVMDEVEASMVPISSGTTCAVGYGAGVW